jgi:hypothetical protein
LFFIQIIFLIESKVIYFKLENDPTLTTQNYIGVAVDLDPDTIYIGQILFNTGSILPLASATSAYGFVNTTTTNTSVLGQQFALSNFVMKITPSSLNAYNFVASTVCEFPYLKVDALF